LPFGISACQLTGQVRSDDQVALVRRFVAHDNHDDVFATTKVVEPAREHTRTAESGAPSSFVRSSQGLTDPCPVVRKQIRMSLSNVGFAFSGQLYLAGDVRTWEPRAEFAHMMVHRG
jgi:hypothetical protein